MKTFEEFANNVPSTEISPSQLIPGFESFQGKSTSTILADPIKRARLKTPNMNFTIDK